MALAIMTDSNSDMPYQALDRLDVHMLNMPYFIDGTPYYHDMGRGSRTEEFFAAQRAQRDLKTSMLNPLQYTEAFEPLLQKGEDILFICMSKALSSTFNNACLAGRDLMEKYPQRRVEIINSCSMSIGMTATVEAALTLRDQGKDIDEIAQALREEIIPKQHILLTVNDLSYLKKSGRLTGIEAMVGSILDIKPIIFIDHLGRLLAQGKVKGRKQSLKSMAKRIQRDIVHPKGQVLRIAQADCQEDAELLKGYCLELMPELGGVIITYLGPVISVHVGPGSIGILWQGNDRRP